MFKRSLWIALGLVALVVFFTVMPTGTNASDVLDGYQNTLSLTRSGTLPYQFMDVIEAKDPLLVEVENKAGSHVDYLWVTDDGTPITMEQTKVSSTFPYRGGDVTKGDYTGSGTWHNGTDFTTSAGNDQRIWQVAIWGGTVVEAEMNGTDRSYGYTVVIDHGNGFYWLLPGGQSSNSQILGKSVCSRSYNNWLREARCVLFMRKGRGCSAGG